MTVEINPGKAISGTLAVEVIDPHGVVPNNIIRLSNEWEVKVHWTLQGGGVTMLNGSWVVTLILEGMGNRFEGAIVHDDSIKIGDGTFTPPEKKEYTKTFTFPAGGNINTPLGPIQLEKGVYKLVTVLTSKDPAGDPGPFAGFEEGPMLQFYP